ncbi:MAG TPA: hypothetical protein PLL10_02725, partial [Elusimicrobiales bacterium]|nr:hypothetical protein [Elusimicrobiales bacterium]
HCLDKKDFPPVLGGVVKSDDWKYNREKGQEEFIGNVSYRAPSYELKADWALDDKKQETVHLKGSVYLKAIRKDGSVLENYSHLADYSKRSGIAHFFSGPAPVRILYTPQDKKSFMETFSTSALIEEKKSYIKLTGTVRSTTKRQDGSETKTFSDDADYNDTTGLGSFVMSAPADRVRIEHRDPVRGNMLALARKTDFDSKQEFATFTGDTALAADGMNSRSDLAVYSFKTTNLDLSGGRPVVWGARNGYDFAMQGDFISINRSSETMTARGKVRGWSRKQPQPEEKKKP